MKQQISEWVDGELDDAESDRLLAAVKSDAALRASWDTYHLIGDALRGHAGRDLGAQVASRLNREPTILAPRPHAPGRTERLGRWSLSAAAAAAAVALVAWVALPTGLPISRTEPQVAVAPAAQAGTQSSVLASATGNPPAAGAAVANHLLAHHRYSSMGAIPGVAPYVRAVSDDQGGER